MRETLKIKSLEQIKLLSDPLKLQLIQAFAEEGKTTKQVAAELGESVTKLYRHVDALFADKDDEEATGVARDILRSAESEILTALADDGSRDAQEAIFLRLRCKASPEKIAELREALKEWLELAQNHKEPDDENAEEIGALIAFYPIK